MPEKLRVKARVGDSLVCPGCDEILTLDLDNGWRNSRGYTCYPTNTTHSMHIETTLVKDPV